MKQLMKIGLVSSLGLALAIPACAENDAQSKAVIAKPVISTSNTMLMGSLGTRTSTASVAAIVIVSAAEAVSSTGHTK
jgi:hypothetical protein